MGWMLKEYCQGGCGDQDLNHTKDFIQCIGEEFNADDWNAKHGASCTLGVGCNPVPPHAPRDVDCSWIEDADEVDAWSRNATKSVLATSAAQNETQEQARLRHELQQAGVYPLHARGILKRAAMNQAMLQNVPQQALPNSPRLPRLASPRGTNEK